MSEKRLEIGTYTPLNGPAVTWTEDFFNGLEVEAEIDRGRSYFASGSQGMIGLNLQHGGIVNISLRSEIRRETLETTLIYFHKKGNVPEPMWDAIVGRMTGMAPEEGMDGFYAVKEIRELGKGGLQIYVNAVNTPGKNYSNYSRQIAEFFSLAEKMIGTSSGLQTLTDELGKLRQRY